MVVTLLSRLWADECGAVLSTEYLMLGSIVAAGGTTGMVALRDAVADECRDVGGSIREVRLAHMPKLPQQGAAAQQPNAVGQLPYWAPAPTGGPVCLNCVGGPTP